MLTFNISPIIHCNCTFLSTLHWISLNKTTKRMWVRDPVITKWCKECLISHQSLNYYTGNWKANSWSCQISDIPCKQNINQSQISVLNWLLIIQNICLALCFGSVVVFCAMQKITFYFLQEARTWEGLSIQLPINPTLKGFHT